MDLINYVGKRVKVVLENDYIYEGMLLSTGENFIKVRDKYDKIVFISTKHIRTFEGVER